jgi:(2S)-methylsuccinyl-CoA dehydrogenase
MATLMTAHGLDSEVASAVAQVADAITGLVRQALDALGKRVLDGKRISSERLDQDQMAAHAIAYLAAEGAAIRQLGVWLAGLEAVGQATDLERLTSALYAADFVRQVSGGIELSSSESVPLSDLGLDRSAVAQAFASVTPFADRFGTSACHMELAALVKEQRFGASGLFDDTLEATQAEFRKFADREVAPIAQDIHRRDVLIPLEMLEKLAELGVFGLTVPEEFGGLGLGKVAMCVVTEELSRGYIGVGSLGTRAEIAAELIMGGGTPAQKAQHLPRIVGGQTLPTAVFTEPNHGSDLAHIRTRAARQNGAFVVSGQKTWITHACRADLMTLLVRTNPSEPGYAGLSMLLAPKTRTGRPDQAEFVDSGLTGTEIKVLGYRGMKEYELSFDGFTVPEDALLGGVEGQGFKQLMTTFESARIQTAARGVGIAQAAMETATRYATERVQFGRPIFGFPRVARKISRMVCRTQAARQLSLYAARMKDSGKRCDLEAGMAKLLATRAAWEAADACVQIHGGNGYAEEYVASRLLVDARVLSIFEGANEIQAHVVARRLLETNQEGGGGVA